MASKDSNKPRCSGITGKGERCSHTVSNAGDLCHSHDPNKAQRRKEIASQGGKLSRKGNPCEEIVELRRELKELAGQIREKKVSPGIGSVVNQVLGTLLRTFEQERKQKEFDDLEERLQEVERMHARKLDTPTSYNTFDVGGGWVR